MSPGFSAADTVIAFSAARELMRLFAYTVPALALIWYLVLEKKSLNLSGPPAPRKNDFYTLAIGFPGLILIGAGISVLTANLTPFIMPPEIGRPGNPGGWILLVFSCAGTGYLEESFFRFYLLQKLRNWIASAPVRVIFSVFLFALCHGYEGPWGILNAVLAGLLLSTLFEKYKSLHGIAFAHAFYNIFVYVTGM